MNFPQIKNQDINYIERPANHINVKFRLGNFCNYSCSYCIAKSGKLGRIEKSAPDDSFLKNCTRALLVIKNLLRNNDKRILLDFIGGETTFYPIEDILKTAKRFKIKGLGDQVKITTNLSRPYSYFKNLSEQFPDTHFIMKASFHEEFVKWEDFLKKILQVSTIENMEWEVQFTVAKSNYTLLPKIVDDCIKHNVPLKVDKCRYRDKEGNLLLEELPPEVDKIIYTKPPFFTSRVTCNYSDNKNIQMFKIADVLSFCKDFSSRGMMCDCPSHFLTIEVPLHKMIFGCSYLKREFSYYDVPKNLRREDFLENVKCPESMCFCFHGTHLSKSKDQSNL